MADEPFSHDGSNTRRLDRVESDVASLSSSLTKVEAKIDGFGAVLGEIKEGIKTRDHREAQSELAKRPSIVAIISVLATVVAGLIGGAWVIGYALGSLNERDEQRDKEVSRMHGEIDRLEARQWNRRAAQ